LTIKAENSIDIFDVHFLVRTHPKQEYGTMYVNLCGSPMAELVPEDIFRIHPQIRWVGFASERGEVVFSKMRPGVESYSPETDDQNLLEIGGLIMNGVAQRSTQWLGKCDFVLVAYDKATELVARTEGGYLALTVDKSVPFDKVVRIAKALPELKSS
jgi:hypothetical protein